MLAGRRAIVTGASRGIGLSISKSLAELGASVTMLARNSDALYDNVKTLATPEKQEHKFVSYDLAALARGQEPENHGFLLEAFNESSILVNCAGTTANTLLARAPQQSIVDTISTNLIAPIVLSKLAIKPFTKISKLQDQKPVIVNVASVLSFTGITSPGTTVYAALKAGLLGFTKSLASELRGSIRVNAVLPALVKETDMGKTAPAGNNFPVIKMEDAVNNTVELITDESLNGKLLIADGKGPRFLETSPNK
uniref:3-oxoacyl-[acyl-carrier-protein] reductase n=1 Tax=Candidozyma auris TaxID=498019 RepID=A0A0L0P8D1_CANAR